MLRQSLFMIVRGTHASGEDRRKMLAAKDWFRLSRKTDGRRLAWIPEPVKLDMHDEEKMNRVFVLPDHTLVIRNFQPCTLYTVYFPFDWFIFEPVRI